MKDFIKSLGIVIFINKMIELKTYLLMFIIPFLIFYCFIWIILCLFCFFLWRMPEHIPLPFVGDTIIDRVLLLIGIILSIMYHYDKRYKEEKKDLYK